MIDRALKMHPAALLALPATLSMLAVAPALRAELVVFEHGSVLKVASHWDTGDRIEIRFPGGGSLTFDRALVERIEADEVEPQEAPASPAQPPPQPPARAEASRPVVNEPAAAMTEPDVALDPPKASEKKQPAPTPRRHKRRR